MLPLQPFRPAHPPALDPHMDCANALLLSDRTDSVGRLPRLVRPFEHPCRHVFPLTQWAFVLRLLMV